MNLLAFARTLLLHDTPLAHAEPKTLRYQLWLIAEWPVDAEAPTGHWIFNMAEDIPPERLVRLARLRWKIELEDRAGL